MEHKLCLQCQGPIVARPEEIALREKLAPLINGKSYVLPEPTLCFLCRLKRRMLWRNDRNLYERKCDKSGQTLISMFHPEAEATVWHKDLWWADDWEARDYGQDFDFNKSFFEQYKALLAKVPMPNVMTLNSENSLYTNYNMSNKNCYLCFAGNYLEDSLYSYNAQNSKDCVDCLFVFDCELCYECVHCNDSYNLKYSLHSKNCKDSYFLEDCSNCSDCFMCWNLRGKQYCFMNKQYSKEEYEKLLAGIDFGDYEVMSGLWLKWREMSKEQIKPQFHNLNIENCSGDYIDGAKNCKSCYMLSSGAEDCCYVFNSFPSLKDALDCTNCGEHAELTYESMACGENIRSIYFSHTTVDGSRDMYYCNFTFNSKDCFGCTGLRNAQYCILNKQYTKEEYFELIPRIIAHMGGEERTARLRSETSNPALPVASRSELIHKEWGEYFPAWTSYFAYNQSWAQEYFPLKKEEALQQGFSWYEKESATDQDARNTSMSVQTNKVPNNIKDVDDSVLNEVFTCEKSGKLFKITKAELAFYKKHGLPLPRLHPDMRHVRRMEMKNPYMFWQRTCGKCGKSISTACSSEKAKTVFCYECYLQEVY